MEHWTSYPEEYLDVSKMSLNSSIPNNAITPVQTNSSIQDETLQQLKFGLAKMMSTMERLEQRLNRVEQTTSTILKNQQETLQVPFMSQTELDKARQVAEQLEHDTKVAQQLQAAFNKEAEVKKLTKTTVSYQAPRLAECPLCGGRFAQPELEGHVNACLEMFSSDPKKEKQVAQVKQQKESGFFGKFFDFHKTSKTETTKVITRTTSSSSATAPLLQNQENEGMMQNFYPSPYAFPQFNGTNNNNGGVPMMMPMYMYPNYPSTHMGNHE